VTVAFWITKALTSGVGVSSSDYLVHRLPPVIAVAIGGVALAIALALQFADWMGVSPARGGLDLGAGRSALRWQC
jgi:uncharacterized membrane-anchored protein